MLNKEEESIKKWSVTIIFNDDEKKASCSCGNQWVPDDINDINCNECVQGVRKES